MADLLKSLRDFAQSKSSQQPPSYQHLPLLEPVDFSSWPWIKVEKLFREYLCFNRETSNINDHKVDYSPLLWSDKARKEALKFFCEANHLIRVTIYPKHRKDLDARSILEPLEQLRVPVELFDDEMLATLTAGVTLHIQLGEGCGKEEPTYAKHVVYDRIFGYNKHAWIEYCQTLATNTVPAYPGMTINIHPKYQSNYRDLVPDFLLHLSHIRNAERVNIPGTKHIAFFQTLRTRITSIPTSAWEWQDLLIGLLEEATYKAENETFKAGYALICRANNIAEQALNLIDILSKQGNWEESQKLGLNGVLAICIKTFVIYGWATHVLLEAQVGNGPYPTNAWFVIERLFKIARNSQKWPGMSERQLAGSYFINGLYFEHLAAYLCVPSNVEWVKTQPTFVQSPDLHKNRLYAARNFFAAARTNPKKFEEVAMPRWQRLYDAYGTNDTKEHWEVKMTTLTTPKGGKWYGWSIVWESWGADKIHALDEVRMKEVKTLSKSQIKKCREKMGLGNCRKEPAGLLRCLFAA